MSFFPITNFIWKIARFWHTYCVLVLGFIWRKTPVEVCHVHVQVCLCCFYSKIENLICLIIDYQKNKFVFRKFLLKCCLVFVYLSIMLFIVSFFGINYNWEFKIEKSNEFWIRSLPMYYLYESSFNFDSTYLSLAMKKDPDKIETNNCICDIT